MKKLLLIIASVLLLTACSTQAKVTDKDSETLAVTADINIYDKITSEKMWTYNVNNISEVVDRNEVLVKVLIEDVSDTAKYVSSTSTPETSMRARVLDVYKGTINKKEIQINYFGGLISIASAIEGVEKEAADKFGWLDVTDKENTFLEYEFDGDFSFETGKEYVLALNPTDSTGEIIVDNPEYYLVSADLYSVFVEEEAQDSRSAGKSINLKNVKTNIKSEIPLD